MRKEHLLYVLPVILAFLALLLGYSLIAQAATPIYVDADAIGLGNGSSWDNAYSDLQTALSFAVSGDEIWVAEGIYYPDIGIGQITDTITSTFALVDGVAIYGGFDPNSDVDEMAERDWETYVTVLSGDIDHETNPDTTDPHGVVTDTANIDGDSANHVVSSDNVTDLAVIDGFTITAGQMAQVWGGPDSRGGGMYNVSGSSPTLVNVTFSGNRAVYGGGMYNDQSAPTLTNVTFSGNAAGRDGGGMYNDQSNPVLTGVTFSGNAADATSGQGGGMYNTQSNSTLMDVVFSNNHATKAGGGMVNKSSVSTLESVTFSNNQAGESGWTGDGAGMYNHDSNLILEDVIFSGNVTFQGGDGGGIANWSSNLALTNVTFSDNSAEYGGGMFNPYSGNHNVTLTNVTFSGNAATKDGGGLSNGSNATLTNVTFFSNTAQGGNGGGMTSGHSGITATFTLLTDVDFTGNSANDRGGGLAQSNGNYNAVITLTNTTFSGNDANLGGGMAAWAHGLPTLINVAFFGNSADEGGGGMYNYFNSTPRLTNVIFSGNTADDYGGGIYNERSSSTVLMNVTLSGNTAANYGGAIYGDDLGNANLTNAILWNNTANSGNQIDVVHSTIVIGHSDVQGCRGSSDWETSCGDDAGGNIDSDPLFVRDPDPGADGNWDGVDDDYGDLHLLSGSPAIDSGTNSTFHYDCPATDLDGGPRPVNGVCDMGAYEYGTSVPSSLDINYDSGAPGSFFALSGSHFPANELAAISVNGTELGTLPTDGSGGFSFLLSTTNAAEGTYNVTASVNPSAVVRFILSSDKPTRPQEGSGTVFDVPTGIAFTESVFLPIVMRE